MHSSSPLKDFLLHLAQRYKQSGGAIRPPSFHKNYTQTVEQRSTLYRDFEAVIHDDAVMML
jgi:hypothetical protein